MKRIRVPSPALVISVLALIVALGGTAIAGGFLTTKKFKNQSVRGPVTYVSATSIIPPTGAGAQGTTVAAFCPGGTVPIGGGIRTLNDVVGLVNDSHPIVGGYGGTVNNFGSVNISAITTAVCVVSNSVVGSPQSTSRGTD